MSRSRISLRNGVFGVLFAASIVFGAAQAFATPQPRSGNPIACDRYVSGSFEYCSEECAAQGYDYGVCGKYGYCECRLLRPGLG